MSHDIANHNDKGELLGQEAMRWNTTLPADFQRAAPEIYKSMRSSGSSSVRDWMQTNYSHLQSSAQYTDLWTTAAQVDFKLAKAKSPSQLIHLLSSDDSTEVSLRRLASWVYEKRTKDRTGASSMLAVQPPGLETDVAPQWLVASATTHSKSEYQRDERVKSFLKGQVSGDGGKGRGRGKGRGKGDSERRGKQGDKPDNKMPSG
eukprot:TRINITY_DN119254_c0_g1_i1.p1 TRINITY_DN119254_c0_g1~~TRINITY_DN119254_c0_g1_i1.p1  ORF type:complete len:225 (-),score=19.05 TRINITY_DN119254_c0_g1_i1:615-1226(-)